MAKMQLDGMENLLSEIERLGQKGARIENKALREAGDVVKEAILREVPVLTGTLKASITRSNVKTKDGVKRVEIGPGKDGYYGTFLEFGTSKMSADPFMSRGYDKSKDSAESKIADEIKKGLGL